jgi:tetratricopeptide (TPR) repeat protein
VTQRTSTFTRQTVVRPLQAFQQAVALHERARLWEAEQLYDVVLKADDRHFGAIYRLGLIRLQQARFLDAMHLFRRAVKIDRRSADAQFHLAVACTGLDRLEEAVQRFQKSLTLKPAFPEAHNNLGHALQLLGRHQEAAVHYEKALAIVPSYAEARNNLGNALQKLGRSKEAIAQYEKALSIRPRYAEAHNNLGNAIAALGRHEDAIAHYEKAVTIRPTYADAYHSFGNALGALGRHREAIAQYEKALAIRPDYIESHLELGNALEALGHHEDGISHYEKVLAISPQHLEALAARGHALKKIGEDAAAAAVFEGLVQRGANSIDVLLALTTVPATFISIDLLSELGKVTRCDEDKTQFDNYAAFVRATGLDRAGRHAEAWEHLRLANRAFFLASQEDFGAEVSRQRTTCERLRTTPAKVGVGGWDSAQAVSLFILGPSRCGKTTLEKLVSALAGVKRGYENPSVEDAMRRAFQTAALAPSTWFENLPPTLHAVCHDMYADELARRAGSARVLTGTNPARVHDADLMATAFTNVRFLCVKRNVEDNVLRIYQRTYKRGNIYAYDLNAARGYVVWYHQVMDLLAEKFPDFVRVIYYEEMVADPPAAVCTAADLCGLPMTDRPLPVVGDDRDCAAPYRQLMAAELKP